MPNVSCYSELAMFVVFLIIKKINKTTIPPVLFCLANSWIPFTFLNPPPPKKKKN